jgi:hypothetical protein
MAPVLVSTAKIAPRKLELTPLIKDLSSTSRLVPLRILMRGR